MAIHPDIYQQIVAELAPGPDRCNLLDLAPAGFQRPVRPLQTPATPDPAYSPQRAACPTSGHAVPSRARWFAHRW